MARKLVVAFALFVLAALPSQAQLFGLRNPGDGGRQLVTVDPASGAITAISASISPPLPSASGVAALDAPGHRFFFIATPTGETDSRIYTVDTVTGAVLSSPTIAGSALLAFLGLEFDTDDHTLLGLRNPGDAGKQVVVLDPVTAAVTPVSASIAPPLGIISGNTAIDNDGNRFIFVATPGAATDQTIYVVDSQTGALLSAVSIPGTATMPIMDMQYDDAEDVLYASRNPGDAGRQLVRLNPATGGVTPVSASISPPLGTSSGVTALDPAGNRFFLIGTPAVNWNLYTVDTATGAVLGSPTVATGLEFFVALAYPPPAEGSVSCPPDISLSNDPGACGANVTYAHPSGPGTITCDHSSGSFFAVGTTSVTCSNGSLSCSFTVTVNDVESPTITAPPDVTAAAGPSCSASGVALGTPVTADNCGVGSVGNDEPGSFPLGTTTVTWTVVDTHGHSATSTQHVTVTDGAPPSISTLAVSPSSLWPPNHKMNDVTLTWSAADSCGTVNCTVSGVTSNEPVNGLGDGDTAPDWEIVDAHHVRLRAERSGNGNGRVYTITLTCTDGSGDAATGTVTVSVPLSQKK